MDYIAPKFILAPMAGHTDLPFRIVCNEHGADIVYSEMVSAAGLSYYNKAKTLEYVNSCWQDRPLIVQLFGNDPGDFAKAAQIIDQLPMRTKLGTEPRPYRPEGIDINFGCPVKKVLKQGAGCELMKNPPLAKKIIQAVLENTSLPVSIKIRAKVGEVGALEFLKSLSDLDWKTVIIHGRSYSQGFSGPIDMSLIKRIKQQYPGKMIIANGGISSPEDAKKTLASTDADGIAIARGALGNPWIFKSIKQFLSTGEYALPALEEIKKTACKHARLMERMNGAGSAREFRKHLGWYFKGLPDAKKIRNKLSKTNSYEQIYRLIATIQSD